MAWWEDVRVLWGVWRVLRRHPRQVVKVTVMTDRRIQHDT